MYILTKSVPRFPKAYKYWVLSCVSLFKILLDSFFLWDGISFQIFIGHLHFSFLKCLSTLLPFFLSWSVIFNLFLIYLLKLEKLTLYVICVTDIFTSSWGYLQTHLLYFCRSKALHSYLVKIDQEQDVNFQNMVRQSSFCSWCLFAGIRLDLPGGINQPHYHLSSFYFSCRVLWKCSTNLNVLTNHLSC